MLPQERLVQLTLEELQEECRIYGISNIPNDLEACRKILLDHLKTFGPLDEIQRTQPQEAIGEASRPHSAASNSSHSKTVDQDFISSMGDQPVATDKFLPHFCSILNEQFKHQQESMLRQQQLMWQQQQQMMQQMFASFSINDGSGQSRPRFEQNPPSPVYQHHPQANQHPRTEQSQSSTAFQESFHTNQARNTEIASSFTGNSVKFLASLIPTFGGTEEDDIDLWIDKIESVARIHNLSQVVMLSAATTKLNKSARRWFDLSSGEINRSWFYFRSAIMDRFKRRVLFNVTMQKVEARKWNYSSESFEDYAMDKLALMRCLRMDDKNSIDLLINGITNLSIKAVASSLRVDTLNQFLSEMQHITSTCADTYRRFQSSNNKFEKVKISNQRFDKPKMSNSFPNKHIQQQKNFKTDTYCVYCHDKDHVRADCPKLKKKEQNQRPSHQSQPPPIAAVENSTKDSSAKVVACIENGQGMKIISDNSTVTILRIGDIPCSALALVDTGSPISFISISAFRKFFDNIKVNLTRTSQSYNAINNITIPILGSFETQVLLDSLPNFVASIQLHVLNNKAFSTDFVIGRDFLNRHEISVIFKYNANKIENNIKLFSEIALTDIVEKSIDKTADFLSEVEIEFDSIIKQELVTVISEVENTQLEPIQDDYLVKIALKDNAIYAYSPRRFAWSERIKMREITDDLLERGIIKYSTSPYCARVVPVRKKNGSLRLCVDLRPLNNKVIKQKYPFPLIEDCLSRLTDKSVFTLLDLKDGFYNIKLHPEVTKYFSFATPDGQFEYTRLPFGFCEAPAEFQKRLIQILQPLIRNDKVIVYIDDILIPSISVEDNLNTLKLVLLELKRYNFQLNFNKCLFLRKTIEYLGYIISEEGITLSSRHVESVSNFPQPRKVVELQRFLGLTNYFRKFIKNYAYIAKPLNNLLRKSIPFDFNAECQSAFKLLKDSLISFPVLSIYNPFLDTEIHTDASAVAIAGILLQKQKSNLWAPVAYYSQATNQAEAKYHSFELEMLAIIKTIERFHIYLYGLEFTIITDCHALVHAVNKANINPRIARWILKLQNYKFKIIHRDGRKMAHVDA